MRIEDLLRTSSLRADIGTRQREQAEMLLAQLRTAEKYGFVDHDFENLDRENGVFKGLRFDKDTTELLLERGFLIFPILPIPYRVMDHKTRQEIEFVPDELEVAIKNPKHFISETGGSASFSDHVAAVQDFRQALRGEVWTVDVVMADVATYHQLEDRFERHFDYKRSLFKLEDLDQTRFETFTSSHFGKELVTFGQQGSGWGTSYSWSTLIDPDCFDSTQAKNGLGEGRVFIAIPVVVPSREPLFLSPLEGNIVQKSLGIR